MWQHCRKKRKKEKKEKKPVRPFLREDHVNRLLSSFQRLNGDLRQVGWCEITSIKLLPSQGDGQVEHGEHHGPAVIGEQVSDDGGGDGRVAGFSDAHQSSGENKEPVVLRRQREKRFRVRLAVRL